jgi:membrane-associated protein
MRSAVVLALLSPQSLLVKGGLFLLAAFVFAESGLLIGFFLPGDSLLFIAGFLSSDAGGHHLPALPIVSAVAFAAAVAGDQVGFLIGRKTGPALFQRPESRLFKPSHLVKAQAFFDRHGAKTIVLARFVPIVRTFAPIVAGAARMHYRAFVFFNMIGGAIWAIGLTVLGYYLGQIDLVKHNIELALIVVVVISLLPMAIEVLRHRRRREDPEPVATRR